MDGEMRKSGNVSKGTVLLALLAAGVISALNLVDFRISIGVSLVIALILFLDRQPLYSIILLILATPFSATQLLDTQLEGIPGMKAANILALAAVAFLLMNRKPAVLERQDKSFIWGLVILFVVAVLRSTSYIGVTYDMIWNDQYSLMRYLLSHLVKPLLIFLPFVLIVLFVRTREDILKITVSVLVSISLLSVVLLAIYAFYLPDKLNFEEVRVGFSDYLGIHGNNLADFFIAVYPVLLAYAVSKKSWLWGGVVLLSLCAVGILYSRSAYAVVVLCTFAFFLFSHRTKLLPWVAGASMLAVLFIPQSIIQRALTGLSGNDVDAISAGRVDRIWIPLFQEFLGQPQKWIFGTGRYAIMSTDAFKNGLILQVGHAHSMYFDTLFDVGIVGLGFFLIFYFRTLKKFILAHKQIKDRLFVDILTGIEISLIAFLIRGVTDSFFFPTLTNAYIWINLGLGTAIVALFRSKPQETPELEQERPALISANVSAKDGDECENSSNDQQSEVWRSGSTNSGTG